MTEKAAENKLKIAVCGIKKETITTNKKFSKFIKYLKNFASVSILNIKNNLKITIISNPLHHCVKNNS